MLTPIVIGMLALMPQIQPQTPAPVFPGPAGTGAPAPSGLAYPTEPASDKFAPFATAFGGGLPADVAAAGAADFDGDGNQDLWFLSAGAPGSGGDDGWYPVSPATSAAASLSVLRGRASSLGRYLPWSSYGARAWVHGANFRSTEYTLGDHVLLAEPQLTTLVAAHYVYPFGGDPRSGSFMVNASWTVGAGAFEVATRDSDGDGNDDIAVLLATASGTTRVKKLRMGTSLGWIQPESTATLDLPFAARDLHLLDCDADGISDLLFEAPGYGVFVLRDDGVALQPVLWVPVWNDLQQVFVGDADRDGRDDFGLVFSRGVLLVLATGGAFTPVALPAPGGMSGLFGAAVLAEARGPLTDVVAFGRDGCSFVTFPLLDGAPAGAARIASPEGQSSFAGNGVLLPALVCADVDGDRDEDVIVPLADRAHWLTLRNGDHTLEPDCFALIDRGLTETGYRRFDMTVRLPDEAQQLGAYEVEVAAYIEDLTQERGEYILWGRLLVPPDPLTNTASFTVYSLIDRSAIQNMIWANQRYKGAGLTTGGDALLSIHCKQGPRRYQSLLLHHDGGGEGNKSAVGVKWRVREAPPKADMDTQLLPWN
jgi:hypothetical protein